MADVIYVSYDGMTDPLGRSQVLPYLTGLAALGHRIRLVSLEKPDRFASGAEVVRHICSGAGIVWHPLPYRSRPPLVSAMVNVAALKRAAARLNRKRAADLIHCRSDLAALAGLALRRKQGVPFLFDMRSFWPDERVDGGSWDQSKALYRWIFRYFKARQRELLAEADEIVMLSEDGRKALPEIGPIPKAQVTIIPCCADFDHFQLAQKNVREAVRSAHGIPMDSPVILYLGSVGTWYMLGEMIDFFAAYRKQFPRARMLFVTPDQPDAILAAARERGAVDAIQVHSSRREDVPQWLAAADVGLFFIQPAFSKRASSPTKLGEMLAAGLPVVTNPGVGDVAAIIEELGAGVLVKGFDEDSYQGAVDDLSRLRIDPEQVRDQARRWFDVRSGIARYDGIYRRMTSRKTSTSRGA